MSQTEMRSTIRPLTTPGSSVHASSYTSNYSGGLDVMNGDGEPSVATRPPAYAHLLIDSIDRYKNPQLGSEAGDPIIPWVFGQPPKGNDFRIERNQALINGYFTRIAITQLQFTYAVPTVIEGVNDTLFIDDNGGPVGTALVTLTPGYYTPQELATEFQDAIRAANPAFVAFTVTLSTDNKLVVASNSATTFFFPSPYVLVVPGQSINTAKAWKLLGIGQTNSEAGTPAATQYLDRCPNLLYTRYVDIRSDNLTKFQRVKDADTSADKNKTSIVARVYLIPPGQAFKTLDASAPGDSEFTLCVDYNTPKQIRWSPNEAVFSLDFQLFDEYGDLLYWDKEWPSEFQLTMVASET